MLDADKAAIKVAIEREGMDTISDIFAILSKYDGDALRDAVKAVDLANYAGFVMRKAAESGRLDIIKALFAAKYEPNIRLDILLHTAAENGHLDIVKFFHKRGAALDVYDDAPLQDAVSNGHRDVVKYLVENGVDIGGGNYRYIAKMVIDGDLEMVKFFCEHGVSKDRICYLAAQYAQQPIVEYLLQEDVGIYYDILLAKAVMSKNIGFIKYLEDEEKVPRTSPGSTPHTTACKSGDYHIADIIEDKHNDGEDPKHDAYKQMEDPLLKNVNPFVYKVDLSKIEEYAALSKALKGSMQLMLFAKQGVLPQDLIKPMISKMDVPKNLNYEVAMNLNFPTKKEIEKVTLDASPQAKAWIALLEKNQVSIGKS